MKIIDEAVDQCLLCIDFDSDQDCPSYREVARSRFQPGVMQKEWWRYHHAYLGLRTLVAYQGRRAVGHVEFLPIEHAPRPVEGQGLAFIDCLMVAEDARGQGVGRALLEAAEGEARRRYAGMAVLCQWTRPAMPARFFTHLGYHPVATRGDEWLLNKPFGRAYSPRLLPVHYTPRRAARRVAVDFFHCPQCPRSGRALDLLRRRARVLPRVDLRVIDTGERPAIETWGIANAVFVDGRRAGRVPLDALEVGQELDQALAAQAA